MKTVENKRDQAKNVEMNRARRIPTADKNEQADEEVKQPEDAQVIFNRSGIFLRCGDHRRFKGAAVANQLIADFGPGPDVEQHSRNVHRAVDREAAHCLDDVALTDAGLRTGRISHHVPGGYALRRVHPCDAVIGKNVQGPLLKVQNGKNYSCQRKEGQDHRSESHAQTIVHPSTPISLE